MVNGAIVFEIGEARCDLVQGAGAVIYPVRTESGMRQRGESAADPEGAESRPWADDSGRLRGGGAEGGESVGGQDRPERMRRHWAIFAASGEREMKAWPLSRLNATADAG